jgi:hypothetical protein
VNRPTQRETIEQATKRMFSDFGGDSWPNWPMLPIKRPKAGGGMPECAMLVADSNKVVFANLYEEPAKIRNYVI